ncbi:MAG: hypothetical protein L0Y80_12070 [Ignavibacteriae bacterium]|nr:hypothetical protein [Ignavibacteriota bacterium]
MARQGSGDWINAGVWPDGDDVPRGHQNFADNTGDGSNNFIIRLRNTLVAFFEGVNGVPLDDVIPGDAIQAGAVDGSTLEASAATGTKVFRVKDDGITKAKLNVDVVDGTTLEQKVGGELGIKDGGVIAGKIALAATDDTTINLDGSSKLQVKDDGLGIAKLDTDLKNGQSYILISDEKEAAAAAGSEVAAMVTWSESAMAYKKKRRAIFRKRAIDKNLITVARAKVGTGAATWGVKTEITQLVGGGGGGNATATGNNTSYSGTTEDSVTTIDISALTNDRLYVVEVSLAVPTGSSVADMTGLVVIVQGGV